MNTISTLFLSLLILWPVIAFHVSTFITVAFEILYLLPVWCKQQLHSNSLIIHNSTIWNILPIKAYDGMV